MLNEMQNYKCKILGNLLVIESRIVKDGTS